jgi:hypothetical protein
MSARTKGVPSNRIANPIPHKLEVKDGRGLLEADVFLLFLDE